MTTVPPPQRRIVSMDVLRGIAVLGILLANIAHFCTPLAASQSADYLLNLKPDEAWVTAIRDAFVSGKMRSLLAILFGAGLWMQYAKLSTLDRIAQENCDLEHGVGQRIKRLWPGKYATRTAFLLAIGLFHGLLIWYGDILTLYAVCAFVAMAFVKVNDKVLLWLIGATIVFGLLTGVLLEVLVFTGVGAAGPSTPILGSASEAWIYGNDTYLMQVVHRMAVLFINFFNLILIAPPIFGMFLGGVLLARRGVFSGSETSQKDIKLMMKLGLGIGIPLNLLPLILRAANLPPYSGMLVEECFALILAFGLLGLFLTLLPKISPALTDPFRRVGKVALSTYLLQSVICTALCYSWGFELYGDLNWQAQLVVVVGVWAACLVFASFWTRHYAIGPVEWAWRSLIEGRALPWREAKAETLEPAPSEAG